MHYKCYPSKTQLQLSVIGHAALTLKAVRYIFS